LGLFPAGLGAWRVAASAFGPIPQLALGWCSRYALRPLLLGPRAVGPVSTRRPAYAIGALGHITAGPIAAGRAPITHGASAGGARRPSICSRA
jgi:hypothetical protein